MHFLQNLLLDAGVLAQANSISKPQDSPDRVAMKTLARIPRLLHRKGLLNGGSSRWVPLPLLPHPLDPGWGR